MLCLNIGKPNDNQYKLCMRDKVCKAKVGEQDMKERKRKLRFSSEAEVQKKVPKTAIFIHPCLLLLLQSPAATGWLCWTLKKKKKKAWMNEGWAEMCQKCVKHV